MADSVGRLPAEGISPSCSSPGGERGQHLGWGSTPKQGQWRQEFGEGIYWGERVRAWRTTETTACPLVSWGEMAVGCGASIGASPGHFAATGYGVGGGVSVNIKGAEVKTVALVGLPGGPAAKTPCVQCRGPGFRPWSGTWIPRAGTKSSNATTIHPESGD